MAAGGATVMTVDSVRIICISDVRGNISQINTLAAEANAQYVIHTGDFGFYEPASLDRITDRTLKHLVQYNTVIPHSLRPKLASSTPQEIRDIISASATPLLSEFPDFVSGALKFNVPVYTVWGACEDVAVLEKFRSGEYKIDNLFVLDEANTAVLDVGGVSLRLFGLGGAVVQHKLFDNGEGVDTIAGGAGTMWTTALQIGELMETAQRVYDPTETRMLITHASPGREGLLAQLALSLRVDFTLSGGLHFRYPISYNEFAVQDSQDHFYERIAETHRQFMNLWDSIKEQVEGYVDERQASLLQNALDVFDHLPPHSADAPIEDSHVDEIAFKNMWHFNLPDAAVGWLILCCKDGRIAAETKTQGFNFAYRRSGANLSDSANPHVPSQSSQKEDGWRDDAKVENGKVSASDADREIPRWDTFEDGKEETSENGSSPKNARKEKKEPSLSLYIGGFKEDPLSEEDIRELFGSENILEIRMMTDPATHASRGYCFVDFTSTEAVDAALQKNCEVFKSRKIRVLENTDYSNAVADPYLSSLPNRHNGVLLTNYQALTHPSQPNYVGMIRGSSDGVFLDFDSTIKGNTIVDLLEAKGVSWKTYQEAYPGGCNTSTQVGTYYRKHNPFISFPTITGNAARCANIVPATQLDTDIANNAVPQYVFYTPDINNDGHDTNVTYASNWLQNFLEPRISNPAFSNNTLFVVTFDEQATYLSLTNHVMTVLFGPAVQRALKTDGNAYNHYSLLKTVEDNWNLGNLGTHDVDATALVVKDQAGPGVSDKIRNVVLLVLENRSFDRMMGYFNYTSDINGLSATSCNPVNPQDDNSAQVCATNQAILKDPMDPPHGYHDVTYQITGNPNLASNSVTSAPMNGFVADFAANYNISSTNTSEACLGMIMNAFAPETIPIMSTLAEEFMIFDAWHASFPGSTNPNRLFIHSATSHGEVNTNASSYIPGYPQRTIYNNLNDAGISWVNYFQEVPSLLVFDQLRFDVANFKTYNTFKSDAAAGKLPAMSFIDPRYFSILNCIQENDEHSPSDVALGEALLKEIYETLRASPQWNNTLLIVTYDEHGRFAHLHVGGYYDHVPTPLGVPNPDGINAYDFNFDRLGIRVPTLLISPWVPKGSVMHQPTGPRSNSQFEHSSIAATLKKIFNLPKFLTARDAWAGTFESAFSESTARQDTPATLPAPPTPAPLQPGSVIDQIEAAACKALLRLIGLSPS
ncbi:hypothetical protein BZG36_01469 [Bifiguratus adelaidae]|uniref:RRM domain-containing protein n=1 Tax=Bifiguratus adelaidae TaxID=1938954 RepID=A0A261Y4W1_9FUNG|nr:hypothetical protein BZG36_01469 [Bifiguratus adelaidae]